MLQIASYDVFDTVLTRLVGSPRQVFAETGRRLRRDGVIAVEPPVYAAAREAALADLTQDVAHHPTLQQVATELASRLGLPAGDADHLSEVELAVERETCRAVPGMPLRLARRRTETGRGVVFVSDTPLPSAHVQGVLEREGLFLPGDLLWISAESGASKQDGGLYSVVAADLGVAPSQLTHLGDDRWSDLAHARLHGWGASLDGRAALTSREKLLDRRAAATQGIGPRMAAASRMARLHAHAEGGDVPLAEVAGAVGLPLLAGFGLWVLRQARLLELDRLYFVARDGEVFQEVVEALADVAGDPIVCHYLHGSRVAWQLASTGTSAHDLVRDLWVPDDVPMESLTARELLALVDLAPSDVKAGLPDGPLGNEGVARLRSLISGALAPEIRRRARSRRDLLVRYLDQQGVTGPGRVGLVDVGWTGRAARSLEDVLLDADRLLPDAHLFLGLRASAAARMGPDLLSRSRGWLLDEPRGRGVRSDAEDPVMLVESFAMGSEGHTTGYEEQSDGVGPLLVAPQNPLVSRWGFAAYRRSLGQALAALVDGPPLEQGVDLRPLAWEALLDFWRAPSRTEAHAWGGQPYGEDFGNATGYPLATPLTGRRLLSAAGVGNPSWRRPLYWRAGTIAISPEPWRSLLRIGWRGQRLASRLPRVAARLRAERALRR